MADQALTVIAPADAKARALKVLESNKDCVSFVRAEDLETAALFLPVVSVIKPQQGDFHEPIPGIGILPKVPLMSLIREKAGVNILHTDTGKRSEYVWTAHAFGEKRQPDGSMLSDDASYEFDAEKRAELDFINQPQKYASEVAKRKHLLELCKFAEQKAVTGAQLALIHKLAKVPASYKDAQDLMRGMIVLRIDRNVDGLLRDPQMRDAAIKHALGVKQEIYGPSERDVTPKPAAIEAPAEPTQPEADDSGFEEVTVADEKPPFVQPEDSRKPLRDKLSAILADKGKRDVLSRRKESASGKLAVDLVSEAVSDESATVESLESLLKRCEKLFGAQTGGAA